MSKEAPECPECERLHAVVEKSNAIGEFLDWMQEQGIFLAIPHRHDIGCEGDDGFPICGLNRDEFQLHLEPKEKMLARFFDIDLNKVERERRALLEALRS